MPLKHHLAVPRYRIEFVRVHAAFQYQPWWDGSPSSNACKMRADEGPKFIPRAQWRPTETVDENLGG